MRVCGGVQGGISFMFLGGSEGRVLISEAKATEKRCKAAHLGADNTI
jgi:hypothetical protein